MDEYHYHETGDNFAYVILIGVNGFCIKALFPMVTVLDMLADPYVTI